MSSSYQYLNDQALLKLLTAQQKNLELLEVQAAKIGSLNVPLAISNQISDIQAALAEIYRELAERNLTQAIDSSPAPATMRTTLAGISISRLPITQAHLFGRDQELALLNQAWNSSDVNVLSLVAWGGVGKSALINHWLRQISMDGYSGAQYVYGWSFYSQGTSDRAVSADDFIDWALRELNDPDPKLGTPWEKGQRLARLVQAHRVLLILDGLEPLQYPPGVNEGRLKDPALQSLLMELAAHNPGLCIITTRLRVANLAHFEHTTALCLELEHLSPASGAELLRAFGVHGFPDQLEEAAREYNGHSLALTLLGSYLVDAHEGDIRRRDIIGRLEMDERYGGHARRVMLAYERWLGEGQELDILRLLGLFDRPADAPAVSAIRVAPAITGLTEHLVDLRETDWQRALAKLRRASLLAPPNIDHPDALDTHPLVREHFGQQLEQTYPQAWREGNNRLYEYLKMSTKQFPETFQEMAPLFAAVAHGCKAGRYQEALDEIYKQRIQWGEDNSYTTHVLGALSAELAALANFFDEPWNRPVSSLSEEDRAFVLNEAGFDLRTQGRLTEAARAIKAGLELRRAQEDWISAATNAGNLSEIYVLLGDLATALRYAQESVQLADRSEDAFRRLDTRSGLADVLHHLGHLTEAEAIFHEAEEIQKEDQPQYPLLYSMSGFRYCDLLLSQRRYADVIQRANQTLAWLKPRNFVFAVAMDHLCLGRAHIMQILDGAAADYNQPLEHLTDAVNGLEQSGRQDCVPLGLLARAQLSLLMNNLDWAREDIDVAMNIAKRSDIGLYQADCQLTYTQLYIKTNNKEKALDSLAIARDMIRRFGYRRREPELEQLAQLLDNSFG